MIYLIAKHIINNKMIIRREFFFKINLILLLNNRNSSEFLFYIFYFSINTLPFSFINSFHYRLFTQDSSHSLSFPFDVLHPNNYFSIN